MNAPVPIPRPGNVCFGRNRSHVENIPLYRQASLNLTYQTIASNQYE